MFILKEHKEKWVKQGKRKRICLLFSRPGLSHDDSFFDEESDLLTYCEMLQIALRCVVQDAIQTKYANKNSGRNPVENVDTVLEASPVMKPFTLR